MTISPAPALLSAIHLVLSGLAGRYRSKCNPTQSTTSINEHKSKGKWQMAYTITRHLRIVQAFSSLTVECNVRVSKDIIDQRVHRWFFEPAPLARLAAKRSGSSDFFDEEVRNILKAIHGRESQKEDKMTYQHCRPHHTGTCRVYTCTGSCHKHMQCYLYHSLV